MKDHPRTCGENKIHLFTSYLGIGSPPHLRGKRIKKRRNSLVKRITPAPAGKTFICYYVYDTDKDHPRTCGENPMTVKSKILEPGSPPHLRGKHEKGYRSPDITRITPAPAGKTTFELVFIFRDKDHPRTCGENAVCSDTLKTI